MAAENNLLIKLTAQTRVLLDAGTCVNVSAKTAGVIIGLGRAVEVKDAEPQASKKKSDEAPEEKDDLPFPEVEAEEKKTKRTKKRS